MLCYCVNVRTASQPHTAGGGRRKAFDLKKTNWERGEEEATGAGNYYQPGRGEASKRDGQSPQKDYDRTGYDIIGTLKERHSAIIPKGENGGRREQGQNWGRITVPSSSLFTNFLQAGLKERNIPEERKILNGKARRAGPHPTTLSQENQREKRGGANSCRADTRGGWGGGKRGKIWKRKGGHEKVRAAVLKIDPPCLAGCNRRRPTAEAIRGEKGEN